MRSDVCRAKPSSCPSYSTHYRTTDSLVLIVTGTHLNFFWESDKNQRQNVCAYIIPQQIKQCN